MAAGYQSFAGRITVTSRASDPDTDFNAPWAGQMDEWELRQGDGFLDGVVSGMACTIVSATIAIATGRAYVQGKRYLGGATVDFTGLGAGTYNVYIDGTDETAAPFKAKTTALAAGELLLCTVVCDGADNLSALNDNVKVLGTVATDIGPLFFPGAATTGVKHVIPVTHDLWIDTVQIAEAVAGQTSGADTVDIHLGADGAKGTTIFTTQANRPSLPYTTAAYTLAVSGEPDGDRMPDAGEHLTVEVDAICGTAGEGLTLTIKARLR